MPKIAFHFRPVALACATLGLATTLTACAPKTVSAPVVQSVYVSPVRNDNGAAQRVLFGSVRPRVESDLSFRTGGKVTERLVDLGQTVQAGQVLARIDPADYQLAVQGAAEQQRAAEVDAVQSASDAARFKVSVPASHVAPLSRA
ncbi:MAG: biotin/lipoyl-binding protein [Leptothrix sp. (in: b-proteobacteria)]